MCVLIIFEGPDLAGKTTLVEATRRYLAAKYPADTVRVLHRGPPTQHPLDEYVTPLLGYRPGGGEHILCDRWHLGEVVYPAVTGRSSQLTKGVHRYIEMFLRSRGALLVHVTASPTVLTERFHDRGDDARTLAEVLAARELFDRHVQFSALPCVVSPPLLPLTVAGVADREERLAAPLLLLNLRTYVGHSSPFVLYVGDVRACTGVVCLHKQLHSAQGTAFMPYPATSGEYLLQALPLNPFAGLINVNDVDDPRQVASLVTARCSVVALGRLAQKTLTKLGVPHTAVPHPQFARRFHHHDVAHYAHLLSLRDEGDHVTWPVTRTSTLRRDEKRITSSSSTY